MKEIGGTTDIAVLLPRFSETFDCGIRHIEQNGQHRIERLCPKTNEWKVFVGGADLSWIEGFLMGLMYGKRVIQGKFDV